MKILIVDDEKDFSDKLASFLQMLGHEVTNTYTGEEALQLLEKEKPNVLILDFKLSSSGVLNGDDLLTHLKSVSPDTTPIVITGYNSERVRKLLAEKGAARCLFKPIQLSQIESIINELKE